MQVSIRKLPGLASRLAHTLNSPTPAFTIPLRGSSLSSAPSSSSSPSSAAPFPSSLSSASTYLSRKLSGPFSAGPSHRDFSPAASQPTNPLDRVGQNRYERARSAYYNRRMAYYAIGCVASMSGLLGTILLFGGDPDVPAAHQCDGPAGLDSSTPPVLRTRDGVELVPTEISSVPYFPKMISLPRSLPSPQGPDSPATALPAGAEHDEYVLVGHGVRTVSFLSIQVYVVGMYVRASQLEDLRSRLAGIISANTGRTAFNPASLQDALVDPVGSYDAWNLLLRAVDAPTAPNVDTLFRIIPTRSTDFSHLRDGWVNGVRAVTGDFKARRREMAKPAQDPLAPVDPGMVGNDSADIESESFAAAMRSFQALLGGRGKVPYGNGVILRRRGADGALDLFAETAAADGGKKKKTKGSGTEPGDTLVNGSSSTEKMFLGTVTDERISRLIWLRYLAGKNCSSEKARQSIATGISQSW